MSTALAFSIGCHCEERQRLPVLSQHREPRSGPRQESSLSLRGASATACPEPAPRAPKRSATGKQSVTAWIVCDEAVSLSSVPRILITATLATHRLCNSRGLCLLSLDYRANSGIMEAAVSSKPTGTGPVTTDRQRAGNRKGPWRPGGDHHGSHPSCAYPGPRHTTGIVGADPLRTGRVTRETASREQNERGDLPVSNCTDRR
jgi:hypothetical protein